MKPLWECDAHRVGHEPRELTVFMGVSVSTADQRRIRAAIEKEVREQVAGDILEWGQQYVMGTFSEPGHLRWVCDHALAWAICDTCFTNAGHATQVAARIALGGIS